MLPATAGRFWVRTTGAQMILAAIIGTLASGSGLLVSFYLNVPASPAIILSAGTMYFLSVFLGPLGGLVQAARQAHARRRRLSRISERA